MRKPMGFRVRLATSASTLFLVRRRGIAHATAIRVKRCHHPVSIPLATKGKRALRYLARLCRRARQLASSWLGFGPHRPKALTPRPLVTNRLPGRKVTVKYGKPKAPTKRLHPPGVASRFNYS